MTAIHIPWSKLTASPSPRRIPELNGLRVVLVFIVSWYHIWQQSWLTPYVGQVSLDFLVRAGYVPVDGTILLSGFLLFLPYARSMFLGEGLPDVRTFYQRRIMRIVPSYYFITLAMLFFVAIPWGLHATPQAMWKDLITHLTFTQTFFRDTYMGTAIGVASWTLVIEMQAYLIFPLIARCAMKNAVGTTGVMMAIAWAFRAWCLWTLTDYGMVVNQLPNFLDIYALGVLSAMLYVKLTQWWKTVRHPLIGEVIGTAVAALCVVILVRLLKDQAGSGDYAAIQAGQMMRRSLFGVTLAGLMLSLPFCLWPIRFLMGNRVMGWLAAISMNYYLVHQNLAVHLKRLGVPASASETPHFDGERAWQYPYTWLCFGLSVLIATLITLLIEKPGAWALGKLFGKLDKRGKQA